MTTQQVAQLDPLKPGVLDLTNHMMGITMYEKWQIVGKLHCGRKKYTHQKCNQVVQWGFDASSLYMSEHIGNLALEQI